MMSDDDPAAQMQRALALHQAGQYAEAALLYDAVLLQVPEHADALHLTGLIARKQGDLSRAVELITRALKSNPTHAAAHCNLGVALHEQGNSAVALASYARALALRPDYALAWNNRGNALLSLGDCEAALAAYQRACALDSTNLQAWYHAGIAAQRLHRPADARSAFERVLSLDSRHAPAWCALGVGWQQERQLHRALDCYQRARTIDPNYAEAHCNEGAVLQRLRQDDDAIQCFERAIALRPSDPRAYLARTRSHQQCGQLQAAIADLRQARTLGADPDQVTYLLAALGAADMPQRAPAQYVKELFDQYADHFDRHLLEELDYNVPALLVAALRKYVTTPFKRVLDLGCGTGLCGPLLRPVAGELAGVDLSPRMIEQARRRALYDRLVVSDAIDYLREVSHPFDLIIAADVLVYFGDLTPVFAALSNALASGGCFAFSVEASETVAVQLGAHHRYAHSLAFIQQLAAAHGLAVLQAAPTHVRREGENKVTGLLVVLRRIASGAPPTPGITGCGATAAPQGLS